MGNSESQQLLNKIQSDFGYNFKNQELLKQCLTHDSLRASNPDTPTYQRFEFLGDTVLQFIITEYLFNKYPQDKEGSLHQKRVNLVSGSVQQEIAAKLEIQKYVQMGASNQGQPSGSQFRRYDKFVEALLGGVYLDAGGSHYGYGMDAARKCIFKLWKLQEPPSACVVM